MARSGQSRRKGAAGFGARKNKGASTLVDALLGFVLVLLVAGIAAGGVFAYQLYSSREEVDAATLCPTSGPSAVTAVLLDLTDPLGAAQTARLRTLLEREVARAPVNAMISLGVVSEDASAWGARFAVCKPASGADANALYENATLLAERFRAQFQQPLEAAVDALMISEVQDQSPIMESLQALLAETPQGPDGDRPLRLIIVSDLLQNSDLLSFYRGEGWEALEASGGSERLSRALEGAAIHLVTIPRPQASAEARDIIDPFWARYLDQQGASVPVEVTPLGDL